jgi:hypothetical protein
MRRRVHPDAEEVLDAYVFTSIPEVQDLTDEWLTTYNDDRPHDVLGWIPPTRYLLRPPNPAGVSLCGVSLTGELTLRRLSGTRPATLGRIGVDAEQGRSPAALGTHSGHSPGPDGGIGEIPTTEMPVPRSEVAPITLSSA